MDEEQEQVVGLVTEAVNRQASSALRKTLALFLEDEEITEELANNLYWSWRRTLAVSQGELVECACGNMLLRSDLEEADYGEIRHGRKYCDVIPRKI